MHEREHPIVQLARDAFLDQLAIVVHESNVPSDRTRRLGCSRTKPPSMPTYAGS
jgi:hypothetical protein